VDRQIPVKNTGQHNSADNRLSGASGKKFVNETRLEEMRLAHKQNHAKLALLL
jgi:hypothetical protein